LRPSGRAHPHSRLASGGTRAYNRDQEATYMAVARVTEIISASPKSFDDAIEKGIKRADKTLKNLKGAWVKSQKVVIDKGKVIEYRVNLKVTFVLIE
jgi:flavin-binding protein dodecin